jgi:hypothetical protein
MEKTNPRAPKPQSIQSTVKGTEYYVTGTYSAAARETADKKIERLLLQEVRNSGMLSATVLHTTAQKKGVQDGN